jgi:hypothetical protein
MVLQLLPYTIILILISILYTKCESEITIANVSALNAEAKAYKLKNGQFVLSKEVLQYTNKSKGNGVV